MIPINPISYIQYVARWSMVNNLTLSPSGINLFINDPALFIMKYIFKAKLPSNKYALRGKAAEAYCNSLIKGLSPRDALLSVQELLFFEEFEYSKEELQEWCQYGEVAYNILNSLNYSIELQRKAEGLIADFKFVGYMDYVLKPDSSSPFSIDLKTTAKLPDLYLKGENKGRLTAKKKDNVRQQVIYWFLTGISPSLLYVTPDSHLLYEISTKEKQSFLKEVIDAVKEIKLITEDLSLIQNYKPKNTNGFLWNENLQQLSKTIWK